MADPADATGQGNTGAGESQGTGTPGAGAGQPAAGTPQGTPATGTPANGQQGQQGADGQGKAAPEGTPLESYEFKAGDIELDKGALDAFKPVAKELGLTGEQAQKLVDLQSSFVQQQAQAFVDQQVTWVEDIKNDPEVGGPKFEESVRVAKAAVDAAGPEFKTFLLQSGMGNHPLVFKAMLKFGAQYASDKPVVGESRNPGGTGNAENVFFPSMKK